MDFADAFISASMQAGTISPVISLSWLFFSMFVWF
jgi:hypothetical protein